MCLVRQHDHGRRQLVQARQRQGRRAGWISCWPRAHRNWSLCPPLWAVIIAPHWFSLINNRNKVLFVQNDTLAISDYFVAYPQYFSC
jgi:hypothetical protein